MYFIFILRDRVSFRRRGLIRRNDRWKNVKPLLLLYAYLTRYTRQM